MEPNEEDDVLESGDGTSDGIYGYFASSSLHLAFFAFFFSNCSLHHNILIFRCAFATHTNK